MKTLIPIDDYSSVTSSKFYSTDAGVELFNSHGLFSEQIFGPLKDYICQCGVVKSKSNGERCPVCGVRYEKSEVRNTTTSVIKLPFKVILPQVFYLLCKVDSTILKDLDSYKLDINRVFDLIEEVKTIKKPKTQNMMLLKRILKTQCCTREIFVFPPNLRPVTGSSKNYVTDSINNSYQAILEQLEEYSKSMIENGYHQQIVQKIYYNMYLDEIIGKLSSKEGFIRQSILGKRVDFSGRTVIRPEIDIPSDCIKVPYEILVKIFEPFIFKYGNNIISTYKDLELYDKKGVLTDNLKVVINKICIEEKIPVLINRQPTLHRMSIRSYYPIPTEEKTIGINPIVTDGFNADFDGDQMAIYAPLILDEIDEFRNRMINHQNQVQHGTLRFMSINQFAYGAYMMSKDDPDENNIIIDVDVSKSIKDVESLFFDNKYNYNDTIIIKNAITDFITTFGRYFLSMYLQTVVNYPVTKKVFDLLVTKKLLNIYTMRKTTYYDIQPIDLLLQKHLSTISPTISIRTLCDVFNNKEFTDKLKELRTEKSNHKYKILEDKLTDIIKNAPEMSQMSDIINSGAKGNWGSIKQMIISKGYVVDVTNLKVPYYINNSLIEGLTPKDMYVMSHGSRKGSLDRSVNTATTGYLMRKLVFAMQDVECNLELEDCGADTIEIELTKDNYSAYLMRYFKTSKDSNEYIVLTLDNYKEYLDIIIHLRTPIKCKSKKICKRCLGKFENIYDSRYIGIISAQALGERVTQLTMRTFHTGGVVSDIREEIDPQFFTQISNDYVLSKSIVIEEIEDFEYDEEMSELKQSITLETAEGIELVIPKTATLHLNLKKGMKLSRNTKIFSIYSAANSVINVLDVVISTIESPKDISNWRELYNLLLKSFYETENIISLHLEILISNMLRDEDNELARITMDNIDEANILSIKKIPTLRKILTMGYQQFHKNLLHSLAENYYQEDLSILEKIIVGVTKENLGIVKGETK